MIRIVVVGDLNLDIHAQLPNPLAPGEETRSSVTVQPGGSAGTFARTASALGLTVTFIGAVGDDLVGDLLESSLVQGGIAAKLRRTHLPSGAVLAIEMKDDRSRSHNHGSLRGRLGSALSLSIIRLDPVFGMMASSKRNLQSLVEFSWWHP